MSGARLRRLLYAALGVLYLLHNDLWLWHDAGWLFGLPVGLTYHVLYWRRGGGDDGAPGAPRLAEPPCHHLGVRGHPSDGCLSPQQDRSEPSRMMNGVRSWGSARIMLGQASAARAPESSEELRNPSGHGCWDGTPHPPTPSLSHPLPPVRERGALAPPEATRFSQ